jgi:hypothetical protein
MGCARLVTAMLSSSLQLECLVHTMPVGLRKALRGGNTRYLHVVTLAVPGYGLDNMNSSTHLPSQLPQHAPPGIQMLWQQLSWVRTHDTPAHLPLPASPHSAQQFARYAN